MSVIRPRPPEEPLGLDAADAIAEASARAAELAGIRAAILDRPDGVDLASRTLDEYDTRRTASRLFAILSLPRAASATPSIAWCWSPAEPSARPRGCWSPPVVIPFTIT